MGIDRFVPDGNPTQLNAEIRAIPNFPVRGLTVMLRGDAVVWVHHEQDLRPRDLQALDNCIAHHVPNWEARDRRLEFEQIVAAGQTAYDNWGSLNATQKDLVLKNLLRVLLLKARLWAD